MQGISVTPAEKRLHDRIAQLGCIACRQDGIFNTHISIHHVHGRTKPGCHMHVLPLCSPHHDNSEIAVHPYKARFEAKYGKQDDLVKKQWEDLGVPFDPEEIKRNAAVKRQRTPTLKPRAEHVPKTSMLKPEKPLKPERDAAPKVAKPTRPKPVISEKQATLIAERKAQQKRFADARKPEMKAIAATRKAEYLAQNGDKIRAMKEKQKEDQKKFRRQLKEKSKQIA